MPDTATATAELSLRALKLRPGMSLQVLKAGAPQVEMQFLAAIEGKGVMLGPHGSNASHDTGLRAGEECVVSGFTGQHDFSFPARVIQTFAEPFVYALLAYPQAVPARLVRQAQRIKTSLPASVTPPGASATVRAMLIDVSLAGAMIHVPSAVGAVGDPLNLSLAVTVEGQPTSLMLMSAICHANRAPSGDGLHVGLVFRNVTQNDRLVLHYLGSSAQA